MNSTVYLFGDFGQGYSQYYDDYTKSIFLKFAEKATAKTQLVIRRQDQLMYYGYIRKLDSGSNYYIGICCEINGVLLTNVQELFCLFEEAIENAITHGEILQFDNKGNVISKVYRLSEKVEEVERITKQLRTSLDTLSCKRLPPPDYSVGINDVKTFTVNDSSDQIVDASFRYGYTCVYKNKDYDTISVTSYRGILQGLNQKVSDLKKDLSKVQGDYSKLQRQKKRSNLVLGLLGILLLGTIIVMSVIRSKNDDILRLNNQVDQLESDTLCLGENKRQLEHQNWVLNLHNDLLQHNLDSVDRELSSAKSVIIQKQKEIDNMIVENNQLTGEVERLLNQNKALENDKNKLVNEKKNLKAENDQLKKTASQSSSNGTQYEIWAKSGTKAYFYNRDGDRYSKTKKYFSDRQKVTVFIIRDGYGLTENGWLKMEDLRR